MKINTKLAVSQLKRIEKFTDPEMQLAAEWHEKWKILISTILSSQTRDETTIKFASLLYKRYPTLKKLANSRIKDVKKIIRPINFHKTKAKNIIETAKILVKNNSIPKTREELLELPGVGRKVANVYLVEAHNAPAIGVDTHVSFLSRVLGWTKNTKQEKIEADLEKLFPKRYWNSINYILVRFGRKFSTRKKQVEKLKEEKII